MSEQQIVPREPPFWPTYSDEAQYFVDRCNECGVIVLYEDELCGPCLREAVDREYYEQLTEERCPPRE